MVDLTRWWPCEVLTRYPRVACSPPAVLVDRGPTVAVSAVFHIRDSNLLRPADTSQANVINKSLFKLVHNFF